jgi:hypothetical protein
MSSRIELLTPVGRLVQGSLYSGSTTDAENRPLIYKTGANAGQPRTNFWFNVALKKGTEQHWNQTDWGLKIWNVGQAGFPQGQANSPTFAWKIIDGDSQIPNTQGKRPCVEDNKSTQQPGVYLNHSMVARSGFGQRIIAGIDPKEVGFGNSPLPMGASTIPVAQMSAPVPVNPVPVVMPPVAVAAAIVPPAPYPAILTPVAPAVGRTMQPKAQGATYEQLIASGWTDELLLAHGMMVG